VYGAFQFQKRRKLFIRVHNETVSVVAMCQQSRSFALYDSTPETQLQLHPALLSLSEISQYFI